MTERIVAASPLFKARIAGFFYLPVFLTGGLALFVRGRLGSVAGLIAGACYIAVTLLFYGIFKPVNRNLSLLAAFVSLMGIIVGPLRLFVHAAAYMPIGIRRCIEQHFAGLGLRRYLVSSEMLLDRWRPFWLINLMP